VLNNFKIKKMKNISKILFLLMGASLLFTACKKNDNLTKQEALPVYALGISPVLSSSVATIAPALADSNNAVLKFTWSNPKYSNDSSTTKYLLDIDSTGKGFANKNSNTVIGLTNKSMTGRELNAILLGLGFKLNVAQSIDARLISSYNNNNERYTSNIVKVMVTPFGDPAKLTSQNTTVTCALATATQASNNFNWTAAFKGFSGPITYIGQYDSVGKNFVAPIDFPILNGGTSISLTQGEMNQSALNSGIVGGTTGKVEYRIKAVTASGAIAYSNVVNVLINSYFPILRVYLPGGYQTATGNGTNWTPADAPELIRDQRSSVNNKMYYTYIFLPAGSEFKITIGRSWDVNYGGSGGNLSTSGANLSVGASGYYRISVNIVTLKYDIRVGRMGFVGGATPTGWTPPNVFPNNAMANAGTNLFIGVTTFTSGGWKLIDNDAWDSGSQLVDETRSYGSTGGDGSPLSVNGSNFNDYATAGRNRVIWDGRDPNAIKYNTSPATEMRIVGDGMTGVAAWTPGVSPQMTYSGNGIWTKTLSLVGNKEIKFLAGNDWGAFDYEDNSGGSQTLGTARKIQWEGGPNFKTPVATGTYTVTLNENTQTVTIN
jgi:starch-binding outer membrane protein SusE/F